MIRFKTYLNEAAGANLHMTHLEDAVLDGGVNGTRNVFQYLQALRDMLGGNTKAPVSLSVKWDGAPAIFAGKDPSDGKFFVAKKGVFNKTPLLYKTTAEIDNEPKLPGELKSKFKTALEEFSKLGIEGEYKVIYYIRTMISKQKILMENRILLSILIPLVTRYQRTATSVRKLSDPKSVWFGTQRTEDQILSQCLQVLERRYQANSKKHQELGM